MRRIPNARAKRRYTSGSLSYHILFLLPERNCTTTCPAIANANAERPKKSTTKNTDTNALPVGTPSQFRKVGIPGESVSLLLMIVAGSTNCRRSKGRSSDVLCGRMNTNTERDRIPCAFLNMGCDCNARILYGESIRPVYSSGSWTSVGSLEPVIYRMRSIARWRTEESVNRPTDHSILDENAV